MSLQSRLDVIQGKWVYVWRVSNIFGGDVPKIIQALQHADVTGIALKVHNGSYKWDDPELFQVKEFVDACFEAGIYVIFWGYIYLKWNPLGEARAAAEMVKQYWPKVLAYMIDAEAHAKWQRVAAKIFARDLQKRIGSLVPIGLNSYRFPSLHQELPWKALRSPCMFDCPQVYYRWGSPSHNLYKSFDEFSRLYPKLPFIPAGDMYAEHGYATTPAQVKEFLSAVESDPSMPAAIMWTMDQIERLPHLWQTFAEFEWPVDGQPPNPTPPPVPMPTPTEQPLWPAATKAKWLRVRSGPGMFHRTVRYLPKGDRADVYQVEGNWARITPCDKTARWVGKRWLVKI